VAIFLLIPTSIIICIIVSRFVKPRKNSPEN
jgi:hypothetical protein